MLKLTQKCIFLCLFFLFNCWIYATYPMKSASIQTVVCFPFSGGVIELGITKSVTKDPHLIQHIKTSFLEIPYPIVSANARNDKEILDNKFNPNVGCEEVEVCSPYNKSPNRVRTNQQVGESFEIEGLNEGAFLVDDEEVNNCFRHPTSSIDCISPTLVNPEKISTIRKRDKENGGCDNQMKPSSSSLQAVEIHYESVLSTLLKSSHLLILGPNFQKTYQNSSFISWKKGGFVGIQMPRSGTSQRLLKKVLFEVARMHSGCLLNDSREEDNGRRERLGGPKVDDVDSNHVLAKRRRRETVKDMFLVLRSLVPSTSKVDEVSILDNTIEHVNELERRVDMLESCKEIGEREARTGRTWKSQDTGERPAENYGKNSKNPLMKNRKACEMDEMEPEINRVVMKDSETSNVEVSVIEKDVLIEIRCPWRKFLLLEVMQAARHLRLDSLSVQSTNIEGIFSLSIKTKFKVSTVASVETIRHALQGVVQKC